MVHERPPAPWLSPAALATAGLILQSHLKAFGKDHPAALIAPLAADASAHQLAQALFAAPTVVLAHDGAPLDQGEGPRLIYANRAALVLWKRAWSEMVGMPSRLTAEPSERHSRQMALVAARQQAATTGYSGIRIDSSGRRFQISAARLWSLSKNGEAAPYGQVAAFSNWHWL